ncbi:hypothetical protein G6F46_012555 [Rhizopus delemar]|uniref:GRAM domain-containing protein n=2 Tax=Rhizopus TaxID=4842 RepID=A0A9P7CJC8_9FUNG|nr:hypothetical protein G6F55_012062 [Rhizopus delemar]KAG1533330.1 hypothetical protein G6F51_012670 [Rhizopus arrhizus]KAG1489548.1 hypothetical protein G6F54_011355 [Rhizopus delemar]KAG1499886.1 hypothetical protein G6F53_011426 [Rhizopus delemar]KAG1538039.1 hypothetical protein G6F49_012662 [Rhizopus delemar]
MLTQDGKSPVPLPQEKMFFTQSDVKLVLDCNEGYYESSRGTVILSNQRIIYLSSQPDSEFKNLNMPIMNFKRWKLEQPWFGANYISGVLLPVPGGGLMRNGQVKLTFSEGGAIEFANILRNLMERMGETDEIPREYEPLPEYQQPIGHDELPPDYSA